MCGITGIWDLNKKRSKDLDLNIKRMTDCLYNRGPDDKGVWVDKKSCIALGHRRLSILDLSKAGHQPMESSCGRFVLSFNGEIYNYIELRKELKKKFKFFLFDINKNTREYISNLLLSRNISYHEVALSNKNGTAKYNYNSFFESSGSSLSSLYRNDTKWVASRKFILKILQLNTNDYVEYNVPTLTLDTFVKRKKIKSIDILKVDIDGFEYEFLQGAKNTIKKNFREKKK